MGSILTTVKLRNNLGQVAHTGLWAAVTKQYNLALAKGRWRSSAGDVTTGVAESNGSLPLGNDYKKSPVGWLPVHRDQLRAQR